MYCSICLTDIKNKDEYINNECCNNTFHNKCLEEWYKMKETCPLCRSSNEIIKENTKQKIQKINNILDIIKIMININNK